MDGCRNVAGDLKNIVSTLVVCLCFLSIMPQHAVAQVDEGSISGTVTDTSGAVIPGAAVTLTNDDVGLTVKATTDSRGDYAFTPLRIGNYSLTAAAKGFSKTSQQNLTVNVAQNLQVNVQLKLGSASETVEVTTAPPVLQTNDAAVGQVVTERTVNDLPLNGRNFTFLAQLGAGAQTPQADTRGNANSGAFSANGLQPAQNNYLLDGIDNNSNAVDFLNGTNFAVLPPVDAIAEFKVQTADFSAEYGRSAGAVLNATIKSGTNHIHGDVWEFFRNDKLDAADWFEDNQGIKKGALRQNQFGGTIGGPIIKDKAFFFGDYEGLRRVQGTVFTSSVPTASEISSGFTNLSDMITSQASSAPQTDDLGRSIPLGTVDDPATTRLVTAGQVDPVSGLVATTTGYVRDPFGTCAAGTRNFTLAGCNLNQLPAGRLDPVGLKLLSLYPAPTTGSFTTNYASSPNLYEHKNSFDVRADIDPSTKDQVFGRFSYVDDPEYIPGPFGGVADGGGFQDGLQTAVSSQSVVGYTHIFTPETINVLHIGLNHLHTTRNDPVGGQTGIPAQYGIQGIPQFSENGGLPTITIGGLSTLGSNSYLPSDEISQTLEVTDDLTKVWKSHSFKAGFEGQDVKVSVLQPAYSRGSFDFSGTYTDIPTENNGNTGRAQLLLTPQAATVPNGINYSGGSDAINASNVNRTYDNRIYLAGYFQDDWRVTNKLTVNLGLRYDYFGPINETNGGQANFLQTGIGNGTPTFLIPATGKDNRSLSTSFTTLLAKDGITLDSTDNYGEGLVTVQKTNFAPRVGFAYQIDPKFVVRGGFGIDYNSFENAGYGPNLGENYPFVYNFNYTPQTSGTNTGEQAVSPISYNTPWAGCSTAGPGGTATMGSGLSCVKLNPVDVIAQGLSLEGMQFHYQTPQTLSGNLTLQYSLTHALSAQVAYVFTGGRNIDAGVGQNNVTALLPQGYSTTNETNPGAGGTVPFPDFGSNSSFQATIGSSDYNGLQAKLEQQFSNGLSFLLAYTYSKTLSDAGDLLNGGSLGGYRAPAVPGLGPMFDWTLADFDIRQVLHFSGNYELPVGKNKAYLNSFGRVPNAIIGGWSINWITTLQGGQPITLSCPTATTAGTNCDDVRVAGQNEDLGLHRDAQGKLNWFGNPKAFQQPCELGPNGPIPGSPAGCIPLQGSGVLGDAPATTTGPGFHRLDFSLFKAMQLNQRFSLQFRTEFFNILNHPNFNSPNFGGNGVVAIPGSGNFTNPNFGEIGSTRDAPYDPRQIQFALKLYF
ncbi:MAG: TonB-dependent receptor [Acidobacteria bacterium]|nr:TonB-dependent receptor [Acidobacteriota bacterium]